ncbi:e3 ubiquitin-protein ligase Rnf220 [Nephila pilipes]|uniref:E3 ubiquitin-protein ligase Rnf220 n=1 Tax=Nephila pilipes TaxID=299642 RepID=A0A8X6MJG4_NEPPI|nr:e3 ubiquitin-protein ligase Rnf220 [Nephila pilipes]
MDHNSYSDVSKNPQSAFCGAISGSVCFPMPLMYSPMNSYQLMPNLASFLPMPHPMLSNHALQDSLMLSNSDIMSGNQLAKGDDYSTRALAMFQNRYQMKNYLLPSARKPMGKYCMMPSPLLDAPNESSKHTLSSYGAIQSNGDSNGSGILPPLTSTTSPLGGSYTDKECYLSSPNTEVEEPDSSGKCSTDVIEQKVIPRWTCDSSQPPVCPICGKTLSLQELSDHYHLELDKLNDLMRKKEWLNLEENSPEQINSLRIQSYHEVEKKCPEYRQETYQRVRANRMNRLGAIASRCKKQCFENAKQQWKQAQHRVNQLCSPKQEHIDEPSTQSSHQSMLMLELTVQQLAHRTDARTDVDTESYNPEKNISHYPGHVQQSGEKYPEDQNKTDLADSSCNGFNNLDLGSCQTSSYSESSQRQSGDNRTDENPCSSADIKCHICLGLYKTPVVSVCCWHVHCETCWLKALGTKRLCPQCDTITSPTDLRRIHL